MTPSPAWLSLVFTEVQIFSLQYPRKDPWGDPGSQSELGSPIQEFSQEGWKEEAHDRDIILGMIYHCSF